MQTSITDILENKKAFAGQIVNLDGILFLAEYSRANAQFEEVWLVKKQQPHDRAIRACPIGSDSTLWHGLSRLNPRHLPGYQSFRIHDAVRAAVRVVETANGDAEPLVEILTAAVYRHEFTLYVGEKGVRLDQALPARTLIATVPDAQSNIARYLGRRCHIYGTLVVRSAPPAQFLMPGRIPYSGDFHQLLERISEGDVDSEWLADIEYPQSDSAEPPVDALPESIHIDLDYAIKEQLSVLPGINQTIVKPAIVVGALGARDHEHHFATLSDIEHVYLQNICYEEAGKSLESVIKLKNFAADARET